VQIIASIVLWSMPSDEAGGAEVKREAYAGNVDQNAGVETASGSERVSASDEGDLC